MFGPPRPMPWHRDRPDAKTRNFFRPEDRHTTPSRRSDASHSREPRLKSKPSKSRR